MRAAFSAERCRLALPRSRALAFACRDNASGDAAADPSCLSAFSVALDRLGFGFLFVALGSFTPGRGGNFTPARLAFESPIAMACFAERAPCSPWRMCSISSRTYSPAWVEGESDLRARDRVLFSGITTACHRRAASSLPSSMDRRHSKSRSATPKWYRPCPASCLYQNRERLRASSYPH